MKFIVKLLLTTIAILLASYILPGVLVDDFFSALVLAGFLALLNITVKPLLIIFTLPITIFTLGLFLLVINTLMILLADWVIPGFYVDGFWWAFFFSILVSIFTSILVGFTKEQRESQ